MWLMRKDLSHHGGWGRRKNGGLNSKDRAIMLLKTNVEKMSLLGSAIISMKTKAYFTLAIIYMKMNDLAKIAVRHRERACAEDRYGFSSPRPLQADARRQGGRNSASHRYRSKGRRVATGGKRHAGRSSTEEMLKMKVDPEMYMKTKDRTTLCPTQKTTFVPD
jgi:hypothetical protein